MIISKERANTLIATSEGNLKLDKFGKAKGSAKAEKLAAILDNVELVPEKEPVKKQAVKKAPVKEEAVPAKKTTKRKATSKATK